MTFIKKWTLILLTAIFMTGIIGCEEKSTMEKLGEKADRAIEDVKKSIKK